MLQSFQISKMPTIAFPLFPVGASSLHCSCRNSQFGIPMLSFYHLIFPISSQSNPVRPLSRALPLPTHQLFPIPHINSSSLSFDALQGHLISLISQTPASYLAIRLLLEVNCLTCPPTAILHIATYPISHPIPNILTSALLASTGLPTSPSYLIDILPL
jgi:hypothetical protein